MLTQEFIQEKLTAKFGADVSNFKDNYGILTFDANAAINLKVMNYLIEEKELDFSWATDTITIYEKRPILHMAGVTDDLKTTKFYKGEYINVDPIEKIKENINHFDYVDLKSSTIKYIDNMKSYIQKYNI